MLSIGDEREMGRKMGGDEMRMILGKRDSKFTFLWEEGGKEMKAI